MPSYLDPDLVPGYGASVGPPDTYTAPGSTLWTKNKQTNARFGVEKRPDGRFRLHEQVERSDRGDVFRASDEHDALTCRVELIAASGRLADEFELLARREVQLSERLNRPGFLRALGWGRIS